jgi:cellulose synthase/poly-beta-1,6-N-acetylglucosamine synthase-like glycosyltransferase
VPGSIFLSFWSLRKMCFFIFQLYLSIFSYLFLLLEDRNIISKSLFSHLLYLAFSLDKLLSV